jgi:hypothetical protein
VKDLKQEKWILIASLCHPQEPENFLGQREQMKHAEEFLVFILHQLQLPDIVQ